jgi:hypothetical protein
MTLIGMNADVRMSPSYECSIHKSSVKFVQPLRAMIKAAFIEEFPQA